MFKKMRRTEVCVCCVHIFRVAKLHIFFHIREFCCNFFCRVALKCEMEEKNIIEIKNKRAEYEYFLLDDYTAGLVLTGTEIKSIRDGKANLTDAYCTFIGNELYVRQMHISEYRFGSYLNHAAKRDRKLLLNRRELIKLQHKIKERGFTIIPVMLYVNPEGRAKLLISLARGKKFYDKRESIKEKDTKRDLQRVLR